MLPKRKRASTKTVEEIFKLGKPGQFVNSSSLTFKFIKTNASTPPQISFIAPKNIAKLAVTRNSLRRRGYGVLENFINQFPDGILGVFLYKKKEEDISILQNDIKDILSKIN